MEYAHKLLDPSRIKRLIIVLTF